jgi:cation transport regulator
MPYKDTNDLPDSVKHVLPSHAQDIYKEAFNSAFDQYDTPEERRGDEDREEVAHKVAWSAVKKKYQKDDAGKWRPIEG